MKKLKDATPLSGFCPRYHQAIELIGRRWNGAIIRSLLAGKRRFSQIAGQVPGISDRLLSSRLRELERAGIVVRHVAAGPPLRVDYALTESGAELDSSVRALAHWAERWIPAASPGRNRH
jgi:DNA-binding HxlR family transcriptional regulator